ncbi:hypothetical protein [Flavobacterium sp. N1719]|uniref:hypothetical protein n=1 Tax=Flavobacterium sp. N1719 TaxID=2885633 RepID=UPI002221C0B5|nr:hypothetical protein [Flavobacterium sp. N1719]
MRKFILLLLICLSACHPFQKFDSTKWKNSCIDGFCNDREPMVNDLIQNHLNVGLSKKEIIDFLGQPNYIDEKKNTYSYEIFIAYCGIDPCEINYLEIEFKGSKIIKYSVKHIEN